MNKEIYKLVGAVGATMTGMYTATMTAVSRQQEINANKEVALKKLEQVPGSGTPGPVGCGAPAPWIKSSLKIDWLWIKKD